MAATAPKQECLLAREICQQQQEPQSDKKDVDDTDVLTKKLGSLHIKNEDKAQAQRTCKNSNSIQPADFVTLQSIRSSALARKTNTTSKFSKGGQALFADLLNTSEEDKKEPEEKKDKDDKEEKEEQDSGRESEADSEKDEKTKERRKSAESSTSKDEGEGEEEGDDELISRGPVRTSRATVGHHPYHVAGRDNYGAAAGADDYTASYAVYGTGYECGVNAWQDSPETSGYHSSISTPETIQQYEHGSPANSSSSPFADTTMSSAELNRLLSTNELLPDPLVDFILSYSRQYGKEDDSHSVSAQPARPPSTDSVYADSPLSAGSAPHCSPGAPHAGYTGRITPPTTANGMAYMHERPARLRLRAAIEKELDAALLWLCKCRQVAPGALTYQDPDQDSLLHIVLQHNDVPKAYAVVEQQMKLDYSRDSAPFDLKNRNGETPLILAVARRNTMVVQYLLEAGADPNSQPIRGSRDGALHYSAARGLTDIVRSLVSDKRTAVNKANGLGQSALHVAVRHHGVFDEQSKSYVDTFDTMRLLIETGADPLQVCSTDGKTILHYAVEKCDATIIDHLRKLLTEETMTELANKPDFNHEVPLDVLEMYKGKIDEAVHSTVFFALLTCGASVGKSPTPSECSPRSD